MEQVQRGEYPSVLQIAPSCYRLHAASRGNWVTADRNAGRANHVGELAHGTGNDVMDEGIYSSLTDIAKAEGIDRAYVSRVFKLTRASPIIVEQALAGKVTLEALMAMGGCWVR